MTAVKLKGYIFFNIKATNNENQEINSYITNLISNIKTAQNINKNELLFLSIIENIKTILIIWFLGCTIVGGVFIYFSIIYKGFTIGYTISAMIAVLSVKKGITIALISLLLQNIIFLPAFFLIAENRNKII